MNNHYGIQKAKKSNRPSMSSKGYAKDNGFNARSFANYLVNDKSMVEQFVRGGNHYYHVSDLDLWVSKNQDKVSKMKTK